MPTVLITGGTGFIGSRLALACAERGEDVRVFAQRNTPAERQNCQQLEQHGIIIVEGSVTDPGAVARACEAVDVIYHLAAAQHEANVPTSITMTLTFKARVICWKQPSKQAFIGLLRQHHRGVWHQ